MYNGDIPNPDKNEDLYAIYRDLYATARDWLEAGATLHLDDLLASITVIERLDEIVDMDMIAQHGPLVSREPTVRSVIDETGSILHETFSRRHLPAAMLRQLRDDLRQKMETMQKVIGGLESRIAGIDDLKQRIAMRKQMHAVTGLQKRIRGFANMLSTLHELRWETSFSRTRVEITPKQDAVFQPLQSTILQLDIPEPAAVEAVIQGTSLAITVEGSMHLSVAGRPGIPDVDVAHVVIDKTRGMSIAGQGREITFVKNGSKTDVQVKNAGADVTT
ncbi:MAG: hypothetical protein R6U10_01920 [Thermoplasmatota archaeon]